MTEKKKIIDFKGVVVLISSEPLLVIMKVLCIESVMVIHCEANTLTSGENDKWIYFTHSPQTN